MIFGIHIKKFISFDELQISLFFLLLKLTYNIISGKFFSEKVNESEGFPRLRKSYLGLLAL
jgi:hypothetical protein